MGCLLYQNIGLHVEFKIQCNFNSKRKDLFPGQLVATLSTCCWIPLDLYHTVMFCLRWRAQQV